MRHPRSPVVTVFRATMFCFAFVGWVGFVLDVIDKVRTGHGLDYYLTGFGVEMNHLGVLITMGLIPPALLVGWVIRIWCARRETQALGALSSRARSREHNGR